LGFFFWVICLPTAVEKRRGRLDKRRIIAKGVLAEAVENIE